MAGLWLRLWFDRLFSGAQDARNRGDNGESVRAEYDFSKPRSRKNPYATKLNRQSSPTTQLRRKTFLAIAILAVVGVIADLAVGQLLTTPAQRTIGPAPADLDAENVAFESSVGPISGWLIHGSRPIGSILLLHGVRSNRKQMVPRARWLKQLGYSVLLIDLPAHGESPGNHITFGYNESKAVDASLVFLHREFPQQPVGVIGVSLGAASTVLAKPVEPPSAVVLESMYPTIGDAVSDRLSLRFGRAGPYLAPLLLWQIPFRLDISTKDLRPKDHLRNRGFAILIASGSKDAHTRIAEAKSIYLSASPPKEFWQVDGAAHVDLFDYDPESYKHHVGPFLRKYLPARPITEPSD
ncbi:MAG: alpha/beta hydrolase [Thermomonas sp.]